MRLTVLILLLATGALSPVDSRSAELPTQEQCQALWTRGTIKPEIEGWCLFIDRSKGNCLACHGIAVNSWPENLPASGNSAPYLIDTSTHFSNPFVLKDIISDPSSFNPNTDMPLFGRHQILSESEIDLIVKFLLTL